MILFSSEIFVVLLLWLRHLLVTLLTAIVFKLKKLNLFGLNQIFFDLNRFFLFFFFTTTQRY